MQATILFILAALLGVFSADMFARSWRSLLGLLAALILYLRNKINLKGLLIRLHHHLVIVVMCSLSLILFFELYLVRYALGKSNLEQLGYMLAAIARVGLFLSKVDKEIDSLFR